jgi:hypothetical protein
MVPKYHVLCFLFSVVICGMADNSDLPGLTFYKAGKMNGKNSFFASTELALKALCLVSKHSTT